MSVKALGYNQYGKFETRRVIKNEKDSEQCKEKQKLLKKKQMNHGRRTMPSNRVVLFSSPSGASTTFLYYDVIERMSHPFVWLCPLSFTRSLYTEHVLIIDFQNSTDTIKCGFTDIRQSFSFSWYLRLSH